MLVRFREHGRPASQGTTATDLAWKPIWVLGDLLQELADRRARRVLLRLPLHIQALGDPLVPPVNGVRMQLAPDFVQRPRLRLRPRGDVASWGLRPKQVKLTLRFFGNG